MTSSTSSLRHTLAIAFALAAGGLAGCGPDTPLERAALRMTAVESAAPFTMPDFELTAHTGEPFNVAEDTRGSFTLLFFGYTYCPDVCPLTMAVANAAISQLSPEEQERVELLFVSVDPQRDSIERIATWLEAMRSPAIGLRGSTGELDELLATMGFVLPPSTSRQQVEGGTEDDYLIGHPASLFLITPDGSGRFQYGYNRATPSEIVEDLRLLMEIDW